MSMWLRRLLGILLGLSVFSLGTFLPFIFNTPLLVAKDKIADHGTVMLGDWLWHYGVGFVALALGLLVFAFLWERRPPLWSRWLPALITLLGLAIVSGINFANDDGPFNRSFQAGIDVAVVLLGLCAVALLLKWRPDTIPGRVSKMLAVFILMLQTVALPAIFLLLWWLVRMHALEYQTVKSLGDHWVSALVTVASGAATVATYLVSPSSVAPIDPPRIITPSGNQRS